MSEGVAKGKLNVGVGSVFGVVDVVASLLAVTHTQ